MPNKQPTPGYHTEPHRQALDNVIAQIRANSSNEKQFNSYMNDVHKYLTDVKADKRYYTQRNVYDPKYSQQADEGLPFRNPIAIHQLRQGYPEDTQPKPVWGFHEPTLTAAQGVGEALTALPDILADPRNAWMGLGPLGGMARFGRVPHFGKDLGGFQPAIKGIRSNLPELAQIEERDARQIYFNELNDFNDIAKGAAQGDPAYTSTLYHMSPEIRDYTAKIMRGQAELEGEMAKRRNSTSGGAVPPKWFTPKQ